MPQFDLLKLPLVNFFFSKLSISIALLLLLFLLGFASLIAWNVSCM